MQYVERLGRWGDLHTLAAAWAGYLVVIVALRESAPGTALAWAPTVFLMLVLTGWLAPWWVGAIADAVASVLWIGLNMLRVELDLGGPAEFTSAVAMYLFGLVFLGIGRLARFVWDRTRQTREQARSIQELEEVRAFQARFLNMAAHEIGTPLTPLKLQLQTLRIKHDDPALLEDVDRLERNVARLERLTQDLLVAGRLEDDAIRLERDRTDVAEVVQDVAASCRDIAAGQDIRFVVHADDALWADADAQRLSQVVWNLCRNAFKFTPEGGRVTLRAHGNGNIRVEVEDTGLGMTSGQIEELGEPFTQFHRHEVREGTGLGVYIARGIMAAHGGGLEARSGGPGQGSVFSIWLPAATDGPRTDQAGRATEDPASRRPQGAAEAAPS